MIINLRSIKNFKYFNSYVERSELDLYFSEKGLMRIYMNEVFYDDSTPGYVYFYIVVFIIIILRILYPYVEKMRIDYEKRKKSRR